MAGAMAREFWKRCVKWSLILAGGAAVVLGLATVWTPLPTGLPLLVVGSTLLVRNSPHARVFYRRVVARSPLLRERLGRRRSRRP